MASDAVLPALPPQPAGVAWPTTVWPTARLPAAVSAELEPVLQRAFGPGGEPDMGETHALVVIWGGRLVLERYGPGYDAARTCRSWSMAKSLTHALVGLLVGDGRLDVQAPADAPEWRSSGDPRGAITLEQLLRMSSGLRFAEEYAPGQPSDVDTMLWGMGKPDVAAFAAGFPLEHAPGSFWSYSSGATNIVSRAAATAAGGPEAFRSLMRERLFGPLGMSSAIPKFDRAGTFIGSSFCFCTPQDFARFGLLYLRDGMWEDRRLLPRGWVDHARTRTPRQGGVEELEYGAHWWLGLAGPGSFSANGFGGQYTVLVPELDLIVVRNGDTPLQHRLVVQGWLRDLVDVFRGCATRC